VYYFEKKYFYKKYFLILNYFYIFLDYFDMLILKINILF
jgi:hypothetical protein